MSRRRHSSPAPSIPADERAVYGLVRTDGRVWQVLDVARELELAPHRVQLAVSGLCNRGVVATTSRGFVVTSRTLRGNTQPELRRPRTYPDHELGSLLEEDDDDPSTVRRYMPDLVDPPHFDDGLEALVGGWLRRRSKTAQDSIGSADLEDLVDLLRRRDR